MAVRPDGSATYGVDTMVTCGHEKAGQPCDSPTAFGRQWLDMRIDVRDGTAYATVVRSNDPPDTPIGTVLRLVPGGDHTFLLQWVRGAGGNHGLPGGVPMCSRTLTRNGRVCGA
jgi:hypothetical protein